MSDIVFQVAQSSDVSGGPVLPGLVLCLNVRGALWRWQFIGTDPDNKAWSGGLGQGNPITQLKRFGYRVLRRGALADFEAAS